MTPFPNADDYVRAVQDPRRAFRSSSLQQAVFTTHPLFGIPMPASGSAAVVFQATVDGTPQALRFFIQEDASEKRRYDALGRHFATHGLRDCVASAHWVNEAITVNGMRWPMVQMEWVEGRTLDTYVGHLAEHCDVGALRVLARTWRDQVRRLQTADFAHGDLQHGNVLVDTSATLRLVDFDGSWISDFAGWQAPKETGNPNYQPAGRAWGRWMDTFPGLVIYTAMLALSRRPDVWKSLYSGENMLFSANDFVRPGATQTWNLLGEIADPEVAQAVERLRACCRPGWTADGSIEELLGRERVVAADHRPEREPFQLSGRAPATWWEANPPPPAGWTPAVLDDDVQFTAYRPARVQPNRWYQLLFYAHKAMPYVDERGERVDPVALVQSKARIGLGDTEATYHAVSTESHKLLPHGAQLTIEPWLECGRINPSKVQIDWEEPIHEVAFRLVAHSSGDGRRLPGGVRIFRGMLLIGEIMFSVGVSSRASENEWEPVSAARYRKIFASYSHRDYEIVKHVSDCVQLIGDRYLIDSEELRSGQRWQAALQSHIDQADVFQLFWSRNSMRSPYVRNEWEHALGLNRPNFVRPVYWEDPMPADKQLGLPPKSLQDIHFTKLTFEPRVEASRTRSHASAPRSPAWCETATATASMPEPPPRSAPETGPATVFDGATPSGDFFGQGATLPEPSTSPTPPPSPIRTPAAAGFGVAIGVLIAILIGAAGASPAGVVIGALVIGLMMFFIARAVLNQRR